MRLLGYLIEQVWLAHVELGLRSLVQAQICIVVLLCAWWALDRMIWGRRSIRHTRQTTNAHVKERAVRLSGSDIPAVSVQPDLIS